MGRKVTDLDGLEADLALPPRGVSQNRGYPPPEGLRNWICQVDGYKVDGHDDPDRSGFCIQCGAVTDPDDAEYARLKEAPRALASDDDTGKNEQ
jgi:hypothetical protein